MNPPPPRYGRNADELVQQVVARYFDEESRFMEAVSLGEKALECGEYLRHEQVGQCLYPVAHRFMDVHDDSKADRRVARTLFPSVSA